jgi:pilus assembly protein CpaB
MSASEEPPPQAQPTVANAPETVTANIYVAAQPIAIGTTITAEMVAVQPWPEHLILSGFMRADAPDGIGANLKGDQQPSSPVGMLARASFQAQEPILITKLANSNDPNYVAGALPAGMRVLTIQTNEIEGVAGFVFPGDRVDIMLTHDVKQWITPPAAANQIPQPREETMDITETVLTNVMVLAVDQRASSESNTDKDGAVLVPRSVSLMVSPADAQRLRLASKKGTLTLSLRSLKDRDVADPLIITLPSDISQYQGETPGSADALSVVRGTKAEDITIRMPPPDASAAPTIVKPSATPATTPAPTPTPQVAP